MREKEDATNIIYIRHGLTDFPEKRIYCDDVSDPELNSTGLKQAKAAADFFRDRKIDYIYASPSRRTQMTAGFVADVTQKEIITNKELKERHFGQWEGLYFKEIEENYPEEYANWKRDPVSFKPAGGESVHDMLGRVKSVIDMIIERHWGKTVVVVSHVGPIRMCVCDAFRIPIDLYRQMSIDNASLTRIDYGRTQNNFIYMNNLPY